MATIPNPRTLYPFIGSSRSEEVLSVASQAIIDHPSDDWFEIWSECASAVPDPRAVLASASNIHRARGDDTWSACCLAGALSGVSEPDQAKETLAPHLANPNGLVFPVGMALLTLCDEGDSEDALAMLLDLRPGYASLHALKALHLIKAGQINLAMDSFDVALHLNPDCFRAYSTRAFAYLVQGIGNRTTFKADLAAMQRISSQHFSTLWARAVHLDAIGDFTRARLALEAALASLGAAYDPVMAGYLLDILARRYDGGCELHRAE